MKKRVVFIFIIYFAFTIIFPAFSGEGNREVLRLHILANSNSLKDQQVKLLVRDEVLNKLTVIKEFNNFNQVSSYLIKNLTHIEKIAAQVIAENNLDYPVKVALTNSYFPTRNYLDKIYPAGEYLALQIVIGEGKGANWWCVLYPTLCFIDLEKNPDSIRVEKKIIESNKVIPAISPNFKYDNCRENNKIISIEELFCQWQKIIKAIWSFS